MHERAIDDVSELSGGLPNQHDAVSTEARQVNGVTLIKPWTAHLAVFCATAGAFCNLYAMQALPVALKDRFDIDVAGAASLLTATTLGLAACAPFAARVAARLGSRTAVLMALVGLTFTTIGIGLVREPSLLIALRLLQGVMIPVALSALLSSTSMLWPEVSQSSLAATYVTGTILGGLIGRYLPAALMPLGWTAAFCWFAASQLAAALAVTCLFPNRAHGSLLFGTDLGTWISRICPTLLHGIPAIAIGAFALMFSQAAITTFIAIRLAAAPYNWSTSEIGALYAAFLPALLCVRLTPMSLVRRGARRTLVDAALGSWVGLLLTLNESTGAILLGVMLFSACVFVSQAVLAHLLGIAEVENRELAGGAYLSVYYGAASIGAIAPVMIWNAYGWPGCLLMVASVQVIALIAVRRLRQGRVG